MPVRLIKKKPFTAPPGVILPQCAALHLAEVFHTPGQAAAIRFFDHASKPDYLAIRDIVSGGHVKQWMDDARKLSWSDYQDWAGDHTNSQFLFAVLDARGELEDLQEIRGFVYFYSERGEKYRVKRMVKLGLLKPELGPRYALEVSFAVKPPAPGVHSGSGLISSALRQSCQEIQLHLRSKTKPEIVLFGCVDPDNQAARRTLEAAGFVYKGRMKYDADSETETCLYILNWRKLRQKIREKLLKS